MKTVLITGVTSGFGFGLVKSLLKNGCRVIATGRNLSQRSEILADERLKYKSQLIERDLDVADTQQIEKLVQSLKDEQIDVLINNAGYGVFGPAEECLEENIRKQFEVNVFGLIFLTQKMLPFLRKSQGHIINFSSVFGFVGFPLSSIYCSSKFAVEGFSESLAYELRPFNVQVTLIQPGGFRTKFNDNVQWGMSEVRPSSIYHRQIKNYDSLRTRLTTRPNPQNPDLVVDGVTEIILKRKRGSQYTFGKDAMFTRIMRKVLPRSLYYRTSGKFLDKVFLKELS